MKIVIQRVKESYVKINNKIVGEIGKGLNVLIGIAPTDTMDDIKIVADKMLNLRIFEDDEGKMNLSLKDVLGELLLISQFTLYSDCRKGRRPSFSNGAPFAFANDMYNKFVKYVRDNYDCKVATGEFGADMEVKIINDGPVTIILDSNELK